MSAASSPLLVPSPANGDSPFPFAAPSTGLFQRDGFGWRVLFLALTFVLELVTITLWLDTGSLRGAGGLTGFIFNWGAWSLRGVVAFAVVFPVFEYFREGSALRRIAAKPISSPIDLGRLAAHGAVLAWFGVLSAWMFSRQLSGIPAEMIAGHWLAFGILAILFAATAFIPVTAWRAILTGSGASSIYAALVSIFACLSGSLGRQLWYPSGKITFALVKLLLAPFLSHIVANSATMELGTPKFSVLIAPQCSGFEGAGLMLIFGAVWLALNRRDFRFPQAWLLVPIGIAAAYLLNGVRLAALILIGNAGAGQIALGGFHSQAGWIAFNALALAFALGARRLPWFATAAPSSQSSAPLTVAAERNPVALYLGPFLAILAASMLARAGSGGFEWLYPIRFLAAAALLWHFRAEYRRLDWHCTWIAPAMGAAVFALWLALDRVGSSNSVAAAALASAAPAARIAWIALRALSAAVTVPIAEELAFRGFLLRRLTYSDFESLDPRRATWMALVLSSLAFGLMHGGRWFPGAIAGAAYAFAYRYRGRIGDAIAAHAITNALLAIWVIAQGAWGLW